MAGESPSLSHLLYVLSQAQAVIAPSTGVLHLAASLGVKTRGIYSPLLAHSVVRWGPRGPQTQTWTPDVTCPESSKCLGTSCPHLIA